MPAWRHKYRPLVQLHIKKQQMGERPTDPIGAPFHDASMAVLNFCIALERLKKNRR